MNNQDIINSLSEIESALFYMYSGGAAFSNIKYEDARRLHKAAKALLTDFNNVTGLTPAEDPETVNNRIKAAERLSSYIDPYTYTTEDILQNISTNSGAIDTINYLLDEMEGK